MMRWWRELINPALRCERTAHVMRTERQRAYVRPLGSWAVADRVTEKRDRCQRCGHATPWVEVTRTGLSGITLDIAHMERLEETGRVDMGPA